MKTLFAVIIVCTSLVSCSEKKLKEDCKMVECACGDLCHCTESCPCKAGS